MLNYQTMNVHAKAEKVIPYPKIQSIYKRDDTTHRFIEGVFSTPELEYLRDNVWVWTEKVDGTNIRVLWNPCQEEDTNTDTTLEFRGRTDKAQMYPKVLAKLEELFPVVIFETNYPEAPMCLYGEGIGAGIQKGGGKYIPKSVGFVLFDVLIDGWWLKRDSVENIASKFTLDVVPIVGEGTLLEAVDIIKKHELNSHWGNFLMEGLVLKPKVELKTRAGERIITKVKHKDYLI